MYKNSRVKSDNDLISVSLEIFPAVRKVGQMHPFLNDASIYALLLFHTHRLPVRKIDPSTALGMTI